MTTAALGDDGVLTPCWARSSCTHVKKVSPPSSWSSQASHLSSWQQAGQDALGSSARAVGVVLVVGWGAWLRAAWYALPSASLLRLGASSLLKSCSSLFSSSGFLVRNSCRAWVGWGVRENCQLEGVPAGTGHARVLFLSFQTHLQSEEAG